MHTVHWLIPLLLMPCLAGEERVDGTVLALPTGQFSLPLAVGPHGGACTAAAPVTMTSPISFVGEPTGGLEVTAVARVLRNSADDDWRTTKAIAGHRHDTRLGFVSAALGSPAERASWGVGGSDSAWDHVSMQWDGILRVPEDGVDLALVTRGGGRVWLDLDGNGTVSPSEWGSNGWNTGRGSHGMVIVHQNLHAGTYAMRVQYVQEGRTRGVALSWQLSGKSWETVPTTGFQSVSCLAISGPVTVASVITGHGAVRLGTGVRLALAPAVNDLDVAGDVTLTADLDLSLVHVRIEPGCRLALAGHRLHLGAIAGTGTIALGGGTVDLLVGDQARGIALEDGGTVHVAGSAAVRAFPQEVRVPDGSLVTPTHSAIHAILRAPLTTVVPLNEGKHGPIAFEVEINVPLDAPADLGLGAWRADRQGRWFQRVNPGRLGPGYHRLLIDLGDDAPLVPEGSRGKWSAETAADADHAGLFFFSESSSHALIAIDANLRPAQAQPTVAHVLSDLVSDGSTAVTGHRWHLALRPEPYPEDPYDPACFSLDLDVTGPDGTTTRYAGFHNEPVEAGDRGDREETVATGAAYFEVRFRAKIPGVHHLRVTAHWAGSTTVIATLPDIIATGAPWDDIVHVDSGDPRFFSAGGVFVWPAGCSLNSTYDTRSHGALGTKLTPDRGSFTRNAYLERLAAGGANGCEVWLSPWNLGLEWSPDWPGYRGPGRYHPGHAAALDHFLDRAEQLHMRVNVSLFNHGMARDGTGPEDDWSHHPYARETGGWLDSPAGLFNDARAFSFQKRLFRYLAARYGDSPALLGWKLWAEVNLAHAPLDAVIDWHARASAALTAADPWHHPVTSHWCGDWNSVERRTAALPDIGYLTIDAYKGDGTSIADLLCASTHDPLQPQLGLSGLGKPILVTEFGGSAGGTSRPRMAVDFAIGPWASLVSGHAGAPMLWWFEWIDQEDRFGVYGAVNRFIAGEDLRGAKAKCVALDASGPVELWCRAWSRPGRMLGYVLDQGWSMGGGEHTCANATIAISATTRAGPMVVEWWDADRGTVLDRQTFVHAGGSLELHPPPFHRHLAFKLMRVIASALK